MRRNQAKNVPVSVEDVNLSEKMFKTDVATCKGKSTIPSPPVVTTCDLIELPTELVTAGRKIELAIYVVFIDNGSFLHTVDCTLKFNGLVALGTRTKGESYSSEGLCKGLDEVLRLYNQSDVYVTQMHCDNNVEKCFRELDKDSDIEFNDSNPQEHVLDIEHENRVLQERFRLGLY